MLLGVPISVPYSSVEFYWDLGLKFHGSMVLILIAGKGWGYSFVWSRQQ